MLRQKIILVNNINEGEKLKSLASFKECTFNVHYFSTLELAKYLLQLSGETYKFNFVKDDDIAAILYSRIKEIEYFKKLSFLDVMALLNSLNDLRKNIPYNEKETILEGLKDGLFPDKNIALGEVYNLLDELFLEGNIDEIGVIRYALEKTKTFDNIDFVYYEESHLDALALELIKKASGNKALKNTFIAQNPLKIDKYLRAFGQNNEIEYILNYIYQNKIPFDKCLIVSAEENDYASVLTNYSNLLHFPLVIGVGKSILETLPGRLYQVIDEWIKNEYHLSYFLRIIYSEGFNLDEFKKDINFPENFDELNKSLDYQHQISFDSILEEAGDLRVCFDAKLNENRLNAYLTMLEANEEDDPESARRKASINYLKAIFEIFSKGIIYFLEKYALIISKNEDESALGKIIKGLIYHIDFAIPYHEIRKAIINQKVAKNPVEAGKLYFTSISNASSALRPNLFITGLSSRVFPGKNNEDPMILDVDYEKFGILQASNRNIIKNKDTFLSLIYEASKYNCYISLSYATYNSTSLKEQNASSVIFETYKLENGDSKTINDLNNEYKVANDKYVKCEYFSTDLLPISNIGRDIKANGKINFNEINPSALDKVTVDSILSKKHGLSASAVTNFAKCPYLFYLANVIGVEQEEDIDIYQIIPPNDLGTMAHLLLENLDKKVVKDVEEFKKIVINKFDEYMIMHPNSNPVLVENSKNDFIDMMVNAYEMEGNEKTFFKEKDIVCLHSESGVTIHGFPDKVVKNVDGTFKIVDYKTGRKVKHSISDVASMIQCTIYAYNLEHRFKNAKVTSFEYWYLRLKEKVYSNDETIDMSYHYAKLTEVLKALKEALDTGIFEPNQSACKNCYYSSVCKRRK